MEKRVALIGIILKNDESVEKVNRILTEYRDYIVGRMGIPYREKNICVISAWVDAPESIISALSGKIGALSGVNTKTIFSDVVTK